FFIVNECSESEHHINARLLAGCSDKLRQEIRGKDRVDRGDQERGTTQMRTQHRKAFVRTGRVLLYKLDRQCRVVLPHVVRYAGSLVVNDTDNRFWSERLHSPEYASNEGHASNREQRFGHVKTTGTQAGTFTGSKNAYFHD